MKTIDLMIDLETLDNTGSPALIQIAAKPFTVEDGKVLDGHFDQIINLKSAMDVGLTVHPDTLKWWLDQEQEVVNKVVVASIQSKNQIKDVLAALNKYVRDLRSQHKAEVEFWGNGNDYAWLVAAYRACGMEFEVKFWNSNDVRTISKAVRRIRKVDNKKNTVFVGDKHNAIDDCLHQIKYLSADYQELHKK